MKNYTLNLTEQEVNNILFALAQMPYVEVVELIAKIHKQAGETADSREVSE